MTTDEQPEQEPFFEMQELFDSSNRQRIPKITVAADGSILAFTQQCGRMRRSADQGETWGPVQELQSGGANVIVDRNTGDVLLVRPSDAAQWRSRDNGQTWEREDVSILPNVVGHGAPGNSPSHGRTSHPLGADDRLLPDHRATGA